MVYPTGTAGAGLLLLRISIAAALGAGIPTMIPSYLDLGVVVLIIALAVGAFTRGAAVFSVAVAIFLCLNAGGALGFASALVGLCALSLALLGGGGYSVDAFRFGRRVIKLDG